MNIQAARPRTPAETTLIDGFIDHMGVLPGNAAIVNARDNALESFKVNGLPSRRVEAWHYTDMRTLLKSISADYAENTKPLKLEPLLQGSAVITISNGVAISNADINGVTIETVKQLLSEGKLAETLVPFGNDDTIGQINSAYVRDGYAITIADDTELDKILEIQNLQEAGQTHIRIPVQIGNNVKATIIERHEGGAEGSLSSFVDELTVGDNCDILWIIERELDDAATQLAQFKAKMGAKSRVTLFIMNTSGKLVRQEVHVDVEGEDSDFELRGLNLLADDSHTDITMVVNHLVENTRSVEIVRNVIKDKACGVFQGMLKVAQIAQKTDAKMACNTLLLSDEAEFDAKPELEIFADDVACGHGATVTEINDEHLFYLMTRGISEAESRALLIKAFIAEIIEELENEELVEVLEDILSKWLQAHS